MTDTLEQPVDGWLEQTEVLVLGELGVAILNSLIVMFIHKLHHNHEVFLLIRINGVTDSCQICACVCSAQRLSDTSDHPRESEQVTLLDTSLHESVATDECQLKIDTGKDFADASTLKEPVGAHFTDLVWDFRVVNLILI